jgi:hypothetical protein
MNAQETPLRHSKLELRAAKKALDDMHQAKTLEDYAISWRSFLDRIEKAWKKAERECQPFRNRFEPWQGKFAALRKSDELVRYLFQARNADQHTIQPTTVEMLGLLQLEIPPLGTVELQLDQEKQTLKIIGACTFSVKPCRSYLLLPIQNKGVTYQPPTEHLGEKLPRNDSFFVAEKGLAFYDDFVAQAEAKFFPTGASPSSV